MARPIMTWLDSNQEPISSLSFLKNNEAVTVNTESDHVQFYIANNFTKGVDATDGVYAATKCKLKIFARDGSSINPLGEGEELLIKEKWFNAKCLTDVDQTEFTELGGEDPDAQVVLSVTAGDPVNTECIMGTANDGNLDGTAQYNAALIEAFIKPIEDTAAEGGNHDFTLVLSYSYGTV